MPNFFPPSFLQALFACPGQLWDVQRGPAPPTAPQRWPPPLQPHVAGQDLPAEGHQGGAAGYKSKVGRSPFFFLFTSSICLRCDSSFKVSKLWSAPSAWISTRLTLSNHKTVIHFCLTPLFRRKGPCTVWWECTVHSSSLLITLTSLRRAARTASVFTC